MDGFNLPPGGMGPLDPTDIRTDDEIDTDPDCALCQEAATTLHAYQAPIEEDGPDAVLTGACQHELPSGYLCGDKQSAPQHWAVGQDGGLYPPPTESCTHGANGSWSGDCPVCVTGGES